MESKFGSDIDVFVEVSHQRYVWFALQAKIQKASGNYESWFHISNGSAQWEKLKFLEKLTGCKGFFLMYNGELGFRCNLHDRCHRIYSEDQLGCSIISLNKIPPVYRGILTNRSRPNFSTFHTNLAEPWRILTCCEHHLTTTYSLEQILNYVRPYEMLSDRIPLEPEAFVTEEWSNFEGVTTEKNYMTTAAELSGWESESVLLLRWN